MFWNNKKNVKNDSKEIRIENAKKHNKEMINNYKDEIKYSVEHSKIYDRNKQSFEKKSKGNPLFDLMKADTVSALFTYKNKNVCLLNFASYRNPGGGFLKGSIAQEESLCLNSFLYNVLVEYDGTYYLGNKDNINSGLYTDRALYSEDIIFFKDDEQKKSDVITCAAPNNSLRYRYDAFSEEDNYKALESRISFIRGVVDDRLKERNIEILILGAFGCGIFKQNPDDVNNLFHRYFTDIDLEKVIFAIPDEKILRRFNI